MASTMSQMAYGRRVTSMEDPLVMEHDEVEECKYLILPLWTRASLIVLTDIERYVRNHAVINR
jgi:hypothetical protein